MPSYLDDTYLGGLNDEFGTELGADGATSPLTAAPGEHGDDVVVTGDLVRLPGGITMPKKTFWALLGVLALGALLIYLRRRDRRLTELLERDGHPDD